MGFNLVNQTLLASHFGVLVAALVPDRPISSNPGLQILFHLLYLSSHALLRVTFYMYVMITESWSKDTTVFCTL